MSNAKLQVVFSEPMNPATVTAAPSASCSGSIQVSNDDFASCVPITGGATTLDDTSFSLTPSAPLASLGQYRIRVTTSVEDAAGNPLASTFETPAGFGVAFRHTVVIDGINDFFPSDVFAASTAGTELYVTHDETDLFVGMASPDIAPAGAGNKFVYFLFSTDGSFAAGNALSSDGKAKFGSSKAMTYHFKQRIAGGTYSEYRVGDPSGWSTDWGTQNKVSFVQNGFVEAKIALSELGGASPASVFVTAYSVDYDGDGGNGWLYNMLAGATDGSGAQPRDVVRYIGLDLPASAVPSDVSHLHSF